MLEPDASLDGASVGVVEVGTGEEWPVAEFVVGDLAVAAEPEDGVEPDSLAGADVLDDAEVLPEVQVDRARPQRFVSVRLGRPLVGGEYDVSARGFLNLRLLAGGGDTTFVYEPPAAIPEEESAGEGPGGEGIEGEGDGEEGDGEEVEPSQQDGGEVAGS